MPNVADRRWTADAVRALPEDGQKHECIDGVHLVTPAPGPDHQEVVRAFMRALDPFVEPLAPARLHFLAYDLELVADSMVQPDLFVASPRPGLTRARARDQWGPIHLVVEVLSPSSARYDRGLKRSFYQRAGVEQYWIVDVEARLVERWGPRDGRPEILHDRLSWHPSIAPQALVLDLQAVFAAALDD